MIAVKGNRTYTIDERERERRREDGYDIYDDAGRLIAYSRQKTVPYETYAALAAECEALKAEREGLRARKKTAKEG